MPEIDGLPEGVEAVRYGVTEPNEYFLWNSFLFGRESASNQPRLIVKPKPGFSFVSRPAHGDFVVSRNYATPRILRVDFELNCSLDTAKVSEAIEMLRSHVKSETLLDDAS